MTANPADNADKANATPVALNEWGIPDWRNSADYGDVKHWTVSRWRWEFYRRRDDLRERFASNEPGTTMASRTAAGNLGYPTVSLKSDAPGFTSWADSEDTARFGYFRIPNPRIGDQPDQAIKFVGDEVIKVLDGAHYARPESSYTVGNLLARWYVALTEDQKSGLSSELHSYPLSLATNEVAIVFSLDRPLRSQIENANWALEESFKARGKPRQRRRHEAKWLLYLRTLDARAAGASWAEIARELLPRRTDDAGEDAPALVQKAHQTWIAADKLRSNF
jgi:hypothetical protein